MKVLVVLVLVVLKAVLVLGLNNGLARTPQMVLFVSCSLFLCFVFMCVQFRVWNL